MRGIIVLICVLVATQSVVMGEFNWVHSTTSKPTTTTTEKPEPPVNCDISVEDPEDVILLPDPESCEHYYMCVGLEPVKRPCPPGLHWNAEVRVCDWPELANCTVSAL